MPQYVKVATIGEIPSGKMKEFTVGGKTIVIAHSDGDYLAFDGICTHAHCPLAGGYLDGYTLTCYCHGAMFDISTGDVLGPPASVPLNTYPVKVEGKDIVVEI